MPTQLYAAKKPFTYGGQELDQGQVIELRALVNDERLVRLGYFVEVPRKTETCACSVCGARFLEPWQRTRHGEHRHPEPGDEAEAARGLAEARSKSILEVA